MLDQADTADLLALARRGRRRPSDGTRAPKKEVLAAILSRCVNTSTPLSEVLRTTFPWCAEHRPAIKATFEAYTARKRAAAVLDFDDLLLCWAALLRIPDMAAVLQQRFDHVLVDEYQDTNAVQADILAGMAGGGARITAVGDDAQAIYAFRDATQRNILDFPERFGAAVVLLEQNHRSTPRPARRHQRGHRRGPPPPRQDARGPRRPDGPRPLLLDCADEGDQSAAVCTRLLEHHDRGTPLRRQAVLFRTGHHSDLLELELTARRIPFVKYGGLRFLEAAHVKDLLCLLRLVENPADELAWFRVLQLLDGVGPATARRLSGAGAVVGRGRPSPGRGRRRHRAARHARHRPRRRRSPALAGRPDRDACGAGSTRWSSGAIPVPPPAPPTSTSCKAPPPARRRSAGSSSTSPSTRPPPPATSPARPTSTTTSSP